MIRHRPLLFVVGLGLSLYGCGSSTEPTTNTPAQIRFSVDTLRLVQDEPQALSVRIFDTSNHEMSGQTPVLSSETTTGTVASLTLSGNQVTATSGGRGAIVATLGILTARLPVIALGHPVHTVVDRLSLGLRPYGVAVGDNFALVTQLDGGTVTRVSLSPFQATNTITTGSVPTGISMDAKETHALVTNQFDPSIGVIDVATNSETTKLTATSTTFRTIFSPDGTRGYGTLTEGKLMVIDPVAKTNMTTVPIVVNANGIAYGPGDTLIFITSMNGGISVFNTKTNTVATTISLGGTLQDIAFTKDRTSFFVANESSTSVAVFSSATRQQTTSVTLAATPFGLTMSPDGKQVWAAHTTGSISIIDVATKTVVKTLTTGGSPRRIAFDRYGTVAVVSDESGNVLMIH